MRSILLLLMIAITVCSCKKNNSNETTPIAEYTIMLYSNTSNLGKEILSNLEQAASVGSSEKVKMTALIKHSANDQGDEKINGVRYRTLTPKDGFTSEKIGDASYELCNSKNLAAFINRSKAEFPAKKYILILSGHGKSWNEYDIPETKTVIPDNNNHTSLSFFALESGIKQSGIKLEVIYADVCLFGMAETLSQIKDCSNYVLSAANLTASIGGNYNFLLRSLNENNDTKEAMKKYMKSTIHLLQFESESPRDLTLTDMSKFDKVIEQCKYASATLQNLCKDNNKFKVIRSVFSGLVSYSGKEPEFGKYSSSYDLVNMFYKVAFKLADEKLTATTMLLDDATREAIVHQETTNLAILKQPEVSYGILLTTKYPNFSLGYEASRFDQTVKWSNVLKLFETQEYE